MPDRHVPVRPNLDQLRHQAKDLLRAVRRGEPEAVAEFSRNHPGPIPPSRAKLADAQLALARAYGVASWPRLVTACALIDAIWRDDVDAVRAMVRRQTQLLHEDARGVKGNWGPPMSYAANLGRTRIIAMLRAEGAADLDFAFDRACLQGQLDTARQLYDLGARATRGSVMGPCETLNPAGLKFLIDLGAALTDERGDALAPLGMVLETYARIPAGKHACLELLGEHLPLPDTAPMAVHRGRLDLLETLVQRDPRIVACTWTHDEIYPRALGCHEDPTAALHGTPIAGGTLLHLCVDFHETAMAEWLVGHGADVNRRAAVDADGFGGHTALFGCVVSQPYRVGALRGEGLTRLFLDRGADPHVRASLRKELRGVADETLHEYRDVTPREWGEQFHDQDWVNPAALRLLLTRAG